MFRAAHRSPQTLDHNERFLAYFLKDFLNMSAEDFVNKTRQDLKWGEAKIAGYFLTIKERINRKEIVSESSHNYRDPIKILLDMSDLRPNWKRLDKILPPRRRKASKGSAPSKEIIRTLCSYPDRRIKPIILSMTSAGLRVGAWDFLNVRDLEPAKIEGKIAAGKLTVYRGEPEEYETRISLEAYNALTEYLEARKQLGEKLTGDSPLIRDLWSHDRTGKGLIQYPKRLKSTGVKRLLEDDWTANRNLRVKQPGQKRFDIKATHFGRKFFETCGLKAGLEPWQIKIFRGDILPTDLGYQGFTDEELTKIYLGAMPELSIFEHANNEQQEDVEGLKKKFAALSSQFQELKQALFARGEMQPAQKASISHLPDGRNVLSQGSHVISEFSDRDIERMSKPTQKALIERRADGKYVYRQGRTMTTKPRDPEKLREGLLDDMEQHMEALNIPLEENDSLIKDLIDSLSQKLDKSSSVEPKKEGEK